MSNWSSTSKDPYLTRSQVTRPQQTTLRNEFMTSSTFPKYSSAIQTTPSQKLTRAVFSDLEFDLEPVETRKVLSFPIGINTKNNEDELAYIPTMRRFLSESTKSSAYLVFGCVLFEKIIENENSTTIQTEITAALGFLQFEATMSRESRSAYAENEKDFNNIILFIKKCKNFVSEETGAKKTAITIKKFYESIDREPTLRKTIANVTRALALYHLFKNSVTSYLILKAHIEFEQYSFDNMYLENLLKLLSVALNFKIHLLEVNTITGRIYKSELYPDKYNKSYEFEAVLLSISKMVEESDYKAIGYPTKRKIEHYLSSGQESESYYKLQKDASKQRDLTAPKQEDPIRNSHYSLLRNNKESEVKSTGTDSQLSMKQSIGTRNKTTAEPELVECDLCAGNLRKSDVFENKSCYHKYCVYCLEDADYEKRVLCPLLGCARTLINSEVRQFIANFYERQKSFEEIPEKPQIKTSPKTELPVQQSGKSDTKLKTCDSCSLKFGETMLFENNCGHRLCLDCAQIKVSACSRFCPSIRCSKLLDQSALLTFLSQSTDETNIMSLTCKACKSLVEFEYQPSSRPDYYKCGNCKAFSCIAHSDLMAKCLCYCDKCLSSFQFALSTMDKACQKCDKGSCRSCGEKTAGKELCKCICPICLNKKSHKTNKICDACETKQTFCPECNDLLDECNEVKQACGHNICITCQQIAFDGKEKLYYCLICEALGNRPQSKTPNQYSGYYYKY